MPAPADPVARGLTAAELAIAIQELRALEGASVLDAVALVGTDQQSFYDCLYFSFATYTTVGFGDIVAEGSVRYVAGVESLVGFVLITWTASYLFLEMQTIWGEREGD